MKYIAVTNVVEKVIKSGIILLIKTYQIILRPVMPSFCRFYPTCSEYAIKSLEKYGLIKGIYLAARRLLRCHPFGKFEIDEP